MLRCVLQYSAVLLCCGALEECSAVLLCCGACYSIVLYCCVAVRSVNEP